jgi:hypothetical protein
MIDKTPVCFTLKEKEETSTENQFPNFHTAKHIMDRFFGQNSFLMYFFA